METAPLKSFATWARTALIREVTARIAVVLAPASPQRVEQPKAVAALEAAITAAGGGEKGRGAVADRVAYTWFNRIIALRFMDANGYTGIGVVSPQAGVEVGQPEILADAKRSNIDPDVVDQKVREAVAGLLNGTRQSDDPQSEAYALLLAEYCRYWNRSMPFMFEREGDFTELLMPANLLADDSVLNRAVKVLTQTVCRDVEIIGWLYQFYISEKKDEVFAGFKKGKKAGAKEIPAATQLFTPHWIVRYLVENSLGRLWMLNRPASLLIEKMPFYIRDVAEESDFLRIESPTELKVIDPACGSGHMLTYAFDLLYSIYEEEGYTPSEIPGLILAKNLFGIEVDARAGALAAFALAMKARARQRTFFSKRVDPNIEVLEPVGFDSVELQILLTRTGDQSKEEAFWNQFRNVDVFGSLLRPDPELTKQLASHLDESVDDDGDLLTQEVISRAQRVISQSTALTNRCAVAITNPPYMGSRNMDSQLADFAKAAFPDSKSDLCTMFIERCLGFVKPQGRVAMITSHTWMFIASFERLRARLLSEVGLRSMAHLGTGAFDSISGEVVSTTASVFLVGAGQQLPGAYIRLVAERGEAGKSEALRRAASSSEGSELTFIRCQDVFQQIPGAPITYWLDSGFLRTFEEPPLGRFITTEGQNKTADNDRYLRYHWEVSRSHIGPGRRWITYAKGGKFRRWYGNIEHVVDWSDAARSEYRANHSCRLIAEEFWYREGITWNGVSPKGTGFRYLPAGGTFDMGGPTAFLRSEANVYSTIGFLNSGFVSTALQAMNPTINLQLKDVRALPFPENMANHAGLADLAAECVKISQLDWDELETSLDFDRPAVFGMFAKGMQLRSAAKAVIAHQRNIVERLADRESEVDALVNDAYRQSTSTSPKLSTSVTLWANPDYRYERVLSDSERDALRLKDCILDLVSYAVGCMFGRFSLDEHGFVLSDQGSTLQDYLAKVPSPTFMPDRDNVIPIVDGEWFEDDIVGRFREFLRLAFGEDHFEENLRFVVEALGVKDLRDYFVKSFYKDHVQRYKKRPIYWLFSSPKGSFSALIYMHRHTSSTVSVVLNEYLREYRGKLAASLENQERLIGGNPTGRQLAMAQKEADRLRKVLFELDQYEHDVLYPLASEQIKIDLSDGVKVNYLKFGAALKKIPGLEAGE